LPILIFLIVSYFGAADRSMQTSFSPHFLNKTTSAAKERPINSNPNINKGAFFKSGGFLGQFYFF
jgi:hypothetical protein